MLINFRIENFLSFEEMATLSLILGAAKSHPKNIIKNKQIDLLKFATIYGANASGKTSLIHAIKYSREIIVNGIDNILTIDFYNKNNTLNAKRETKFEYEIRIKNKLFSYGFAINALKSVITKEWLYDITEDEQTIFTRDKKIEINFDYLNVNEEIINKLEVYASDLADDNSSLFLTFINKNKIKGISKSSVLSSVFNWFDSCLEVLAPDETTRDFGLTYHNDQYLDQLCKFLESNDTGITKIIFEKSDERFHGVPSSLERKIKEQIHFDLMKRKNKKNLSQVGAIVRISNNIYRFIENDGLIEMYVLRFSHNNTETRYRYDEESDGTRRLIELFSIISNIKENKVFVVDELERSLHPLLTLHFVSSFLKNSLSSQLIVTTHEDRLLDLSLLRRDEIWFVKKNNKGNSELYSLEEFKERFDKNIMNAYLNGRYGAIPNTKSFFNSLHQSEEE